LLVIAEHAQFIREILQVIRKRAVYVGPPLTGVAPVGGFLVSGGSPIHHTVIVQLDWTKRTLAQRIADSSE
jgi:hypothetical protein